MENMRLLGMEFDGTANHFRLTLATFRYFTPINLHHSKGLISLVLFGIVLVHKLVQMMKCILINVSQREKYNDIVFMLIGRLFHNYFMTNHRLTVDEPLTVWNLQSTWQMTVGSQTAIFHGLTVQFWHLYLRYFGDVLTENISLLLNLLYLSFSRCENTVLFLVEVWLITLWYVEVWPGLLGNTYTLLMD